MENEKVRPFFRALAVLVSVPAWFNFFLLFAELLGSGYLKLGVWVGFVGSLIFAVWLVAIGLTGKAPSILKSFLNL